MNITMYDDNPLSNFGSDVGFIIPDMEQYLVSDKSISGQFIRNREYLIHSGLKKYDVDINYEVLDGFANFDVAVFPLPHRLNTYMCHGHLKTVWAAWDYIMKTIKYYDSYQTVHLPIDDALASLTRRIEARC